MRKAFFFLTAVIVAAVFQSCGQSNESPQPQAAVLATGKDINVKQFTDVNVVGSMQVIYLHHKNHFVKVDASIQALKALLIYANENELYITTRNHHGASSDSTVSIKGIKVYVGSPSLRGVSLTGDGSLVVSTPVTVSHFDIDLTGSGHISFSHLIDSKSLDVKLTGAGKVDVAKLKSTKLTTQLTGSGTVSYHDVNVDKTESVITGSGTIAIKGSSGEHLKSINGPGHIEAI